MKIKSCKNKRAHTHIAVQHTCLRPCGDPVCLLMTCQKLVCLCVCVCVWRSNTVLVSLCGLSTRKVFVKQMVCTSAAWNVLVHVIFVLESTSQRFQGSSLSPKMLEGESQSCTSKQTNPTNRGLWTPVQEESFCFTHSHGCPVHHVHPSFVCVRLCVCVFKYVWWSRVILMFSYNTFSPQSSPTLALWHLPVAEGT